jgi:FkbM family methyltransferase
MSRLSPYIHPVLFRLGLKRQPFYEACHTSWALLQKSIAGPIEHIVHVGAHLAEERLCYEQMGAKSVVWVEGAPSTFKLLEQSLRHEKRRGHLNAEHHAIHALVTDTPGETIELHGFKRAGQVKGGLTTIFALNEGNEHVFEQDTLASNCVTDTLDRVLGATDLPQPQLLVLDVEGAELMVLNGGTDTIAGCKAIICEVSITPHLGQGASAQQIVDFLKIHGFEPAEALPERAGNVLFLRQPAK